MPLRALDERVTFLSRLPARPADRRQALAAILVACVAFAVIAPFARVQLPAVSAFIPVYQSALATNDLITAILLFVQFALLRTRALLVLAAGYLFTAAMAVVHALTFPGLFSPTGLLGAGPQSTAWLYMFWHAGFPLVIVGYALLKDRADGPRDAPWPLRETAIAVLVVAAVVTILGFTATAGSVALPPIMSGHAYTSAMLGVVGTVWALSAVALLVLWLRRPHSVLDVWLMVVMVSWFFDIALAAVLNAGRFDLGFYAGRIYGLTAASFVLIVLLIETGVVYAHFARSFVDQRRRDAAEIASINARLSTVLESSPLAIFSLDTRGDIASWNAAAERYFGVPASDAIGMPCRSLKQADDADFVQAHVSALTGKTLRDQRTVFSQQDGRKLDISYSVAPIREENTIVGTVIVAEDVTERTKLERQLAQTQKMEAVGQLTGGIAHDFNNILTVVTGAVDILNDQLADRPQLALVAKMIDDAATRGAELTRSLLAFARKQPLQPRETDLNSLVAEAAKLLQPTLGAQIEIETPLAADAWPALIDASQLTSALLNLSINARDAMPEGGKLTLETSNVHLDDAYAAANREVVAGDYVMIAVSDTGSGIPPDLLDKVFEPFFTTKELGKGTGLGLSMVFGFIKQSGGHVKIYSEIGRGTTVKMYLPRAHAVAGAEQRPSTAATGGGETILVVEDEPLVRGNVVMQLASLGYRTLEATSGVEAIRVAAANGPIDLLFTDIVIRGSMNGRQLADEIVRLQPSVKVLFTSGYTHNAVVHHGRLAADALMIPKPYRKADLARMLRRALDAEGPEGAEARPATAAI
jgi:PAS domain S-box-containing protein